MTKKLIHLVGKDLGKLVCDNPVCDHVDPPQSFGPHLIGKPCPKCGEDLLTVKDYMDVERLISAVNWVNRWFGWMGTEEPKGTHPIKMRVHDGKLNVSTDDR